MAGLTYVKVREKDGMGDMLKCDNFLACGKEFNECDEHILVPNTFAGGLSDKPFCCEHCMHSWMKRRITGLVITLLIGLVIVIVALAELGLEEGIVAPMFFFIPYMIRWCLLGRGERESEGLAWIIVFLSAITLIYPIYKLVQEIRLYINIKNCNYNIE